MEEKSTSSIASQPSAPELHMFDFSQTETLPERFPRLTCFAIACGLIVTSLIAEIDCLRGLGYYWR